MESSKVRIALRLAYHGLAYHGWQIQKGAISVQEVLAEKISILMKQPTRVWGCGRTDTGVHARDFIAHFDASDFPQFDLVNRLNQLLPSDIVVYRAYRVASNFSSRHHCLSRTYRYQITLVKNPFMEGQAWRVYRMPDLEKMQMACKILMQTKDFKAFAKSKSKAKHTICHLMEAHVTLFEDYRMEFVFTANRFLRNMVRAMVGTIMAVGFEKIDLERMQEIIETGDRSKAGESVPAHGLFLDKVVYPLHLFEEEIGELRVLPQIKNESELL